MNTTAVGLTKLFKPELKLQLQGTLAFVLKERSQEAEAREVATTPCVATSLPDMRKSLTESGLCK